jgi:hypothetical protein
MDSGLILTDEKMLELKTTHGIQGLLDLNPGTLIVPVGVSADLKSVYSFFDAVRTKGNETPIFPMFRLQGEGPQVLAEMILNAIETMMLRDVYISTHLQTRDNREFVPYLKMFLTYLFEHPLLPGKDLLQTPKLFTPQATTFHICAPASHWITKSSGAEIILKLFHAENGVASPTIMLSDTRNSMLVWDNEDFLRFLHSYPDAQFTMSLLGVEVSHDFSVMAAWGRPTFFWSVQSLLKYRDSQRKEKYPEGAVAIGTPLRDRVSAWDTPDMTGNITRKLSRTDTVYFVSIFPGQHNRIVARTSNGDYVEPRNFKVEKL